MYVKEISNEEWELSRPPESKFNVVTKLLTGTVGRAARIVDN